MPEFHKTAMGRKYYDYQLPALIKAIQENTAALKELTEKEKASGLLSNDRERRRT